jgi:hypothetical protein
MSRKGRKVSDEARDEQSTDSVYDFLYHDSRRIGSFLAQLDPSGHLQQVTQEESRLLGRTSTFAGTVSATATVNLPLTESGMEIEGQGNLEHERTKEGSEGSSRVYDPLWTNARTFLDLIDEHDLLQRDPRKARLGQLVIVSGSLEVMDFSIIKGLWSTQRVRTLMSEGLKALPEAQQADIWAVLDLVQNFPSLVQATLTAGSVRVWSPLLSECLVTSGLDLLLKHGTSVGGIWNMVAILDARPQDAPSEPHKPLFGKELILNSPCSHRHSPRWPH